LEYTIEARTINQLFHSFYDFKGARNLKMCMTIHLYNLVPFINVIHILEIKVLKAGFIVRVIL